MGINRKVLSEIASSEEARVTAQKFQRLNGRDFLARYSFCQEGTKITWFDHLPDQDTGYLPEF